MEFTIQINCMHSILYKWSQKNAKFILIRILCNLALVRVSKLLKYFSSSVSSVSAEFFSGIFVTERTTVCGNYRMQKTVIANLEHTSTASTTTTTFERLQAHKNLHICISICTLYILCLYICCVIKHCMTGI